MKATGTKGLLAGLKDFEKTLNESQEPQLKKETFDKPSANIIQKNFRINEYDDKLLKSIQFKRGLTQTEILKMALDTFATDEEKELASY